MKKKTVFPEAKFYVRADKMTPLCWKHVKKTFKKDLQTDAGIYKDIRN